MEESKKKKSEDWEQEVSTMIPQGYVLNTINNELWWILEDEVSK